MSDRTVVLAFMAVGAALLAVVSYESGAMRALERKAVDTRFAIRGRREVPRDIVIVALDTKSVQALGVRPPVPRAYYASLLDRLRSAVPRVIALDVQFIGTTDRRDDSALLRALARDGPVVLATHESQSGPVPVPGGVVGARGAVLASAAVDTDPDGVLRKMIYRAVSLPTLAVRTADLLRGRAVPTDAFSGDRAWIDFRGPPGTFPTFSFVDVLNGRVPPAIFAGKTVLVGVTDPGAKDVFTTAASSIPMTGVEVQANALETILDGFPLRPADEGIDIAVILAMACVAPLLSVRLPTLWVLLASLGVLALFLVLNQLAFASGAIVAVVDPILSLALGTIGAVAADAYIQRKQLRRLQQAFDLLPSPLSDFFISYRRSDSEFVARILRQELTRRFGESRVFMDVETIEAGADWPARIQDAVAACRAMLVLIGPSWLDARSADGSRRLDDPNDWVRLEVQAGLSNPRVAVVPLLHDGASVPAPDELPEPLRTLANRNAISITGEDLAQEVDSLVASIERGQLRELMPSPSRGPQEAEQRPEPSKLVISERSGK